MSSIPILKHLTVEIKRSFYDHRPFKIE